MSFSWPAAILAAIGAIVLSCIVSLSVIAGDGQDVTSATAATLVGLASTYASQTCMITGPIPTFSGQESTNADAVVAAVINIPAAGQLFPGGTPEMEQAAQIALMTAITESGLRDLGPGQGDRDSVGIFQQRPSQGWGSVPQLMDPVYATDQFILRLLQVPGWQDMPAWQAAQAVQRSAFSDGSNYRRNVAAAQAELQKVNPSSFQAGAAQAQAAFAGAMANANAPGSCGQGADGSVVPLPANFTIQAGTPPKHAAVVTWALQQLGRPYQLGGDGTPAYDCSGLTQAAWATVGIDLGRTTEEQQADGVTVAENLLQPGDLVLTAGSDQRQVGEAGHVGIYIGNNLVLSAIDEQDGVALQTWAGFTSGPTGQLIALRDPAPGQ